MLPNTCTKVTKLYPKDKLMFLNTFLIIFWHQNDFSVSQREEIKIVQRKYAKNIPKKH